VAIASEALLARLDELSTGLDEVLARRADGQ